MSDYQNERGNLSKIQNLLACKLAAGDPKLLRHPSLENDLSKYTLIGLTIIFTGFFATCSGSYAAWIFSRNLLFTIIAGPIWGALITTIDSLIMHQGATEVEEVEKDTGDRQKSVKKDVQKIAKKGSIILLRMGFAAGIGMFMATPMVLGIFQSKIQEEISLEHNKNLPQKIEDIKKQHQSKRSELETKLLNANNELAKIEAQKRDAHKETQAAYERGGTGRGARTAYAEQEQERIQRESKQLIDKQNQIVNDATKNLNILTTQEQKQIEYLQQVLENSKNSLPTQLSALARLEKADKSVHSLKISIEILIIFVEIIPQLMKLLGGKGAYEIALTKNNQLRSRQVLGDRYNKNQMILAGQQGEKIDRENIQSKLTQLKREENDLTMANFRNPSPTIAEKLKIVREQIDEQKHRLNNKSR
jgi:hypothetical protein